MEHGQTELGAVRSGPELVVDEGGKRIDQFLAEKTSLSRNAARRLIEEGQVRIDGRTVRKPGVFLAAGQRMSLTAPAQDPLRTPPLPQPELPLTVLYEDADVVVVSKPAGVPSHPLRPGELGTLASALCARYPECATASRDAREGGLCQRLDLYTSGAILAARSRPAWETMREHLSEGRIQKEYLALVVGVPERDSFEVTAPLLPAPGPDKHRKLIAAVTPEQIYHPEAMDAETRFSVLCRGSRFSLVRAETSTGKRHQVRVHLASLGLPLVGDTLYGALPMDDPAAPPGYFLHASRLRFPGKKGRVDVTAPLPPDRERLLQRYGLFVPVRP
jgi:23S rRNA pseudouridine1911/1915/1917 synthase